MSRKRRSFGPSFQAKVALAAVHGDARRLSIGPNEWGLVESQRGSVRAKLFVTQTVQPGQVFVPMHYETANQLTDSVFDPYSKQPSYKACAVRLRREGL